MATSGIRGPRVAPPPTTSKPASASTPAGTATAATRPETSPAPAAPFQPFGHASPTAIHDIGTHVVPPTSDLGFQAVASDAPRTGAEAAANEVNVSTEGLERAAADIRSEAERERAELRRDAGALERQIDGLAKEKNVTVSKGGDGGLDFKTAVVKNDEGRPVAYLSCLRSQGGPERLTVIESRLLDGQWVSKERTFDDRDDGWTVTSRLTRHEPNKNGDGPYTSGVLHKAQLLNSEENKLLVGDDRVRHEGKLVLDDGKGRTDHQVSTEEEYRFRSDSKVRLPGTIEGVFQPDQPLIEFRARASENNKNAAPKELYATEAWAQGKTRVTHTKYDDANAFVLEQQSDDGNSKLSQIFFPGTENTVRVKTTRDTPTSVAEETTLWDSEGTDVSTAGTRGRMLSNTTSARVYAADGSLAVEHRFINDARDHQVRSETFERVVDGELITERVTLKGSQGEPLGSTAERVTRKVGGDEVPVSTRVVKNGTTLKLDYQREGVKFSATTEGKPPLEGLLTDDVVAGGLELSINGKRFAPSNDAQDSAERLSRSLDPRGLAALKLALDETSKAKAFARTVAEKPLLKATASHAEWGVNNIDRKLTPLINTIGFASDELDRFQKVSKGLSEGIPDAPLAPDAGPLPSLIDQLGNTIDLVGTGIDAVDALNRFKQHQYLKASVDLAKISLNGTRTAGHMLGHFGRATLIGRGLGAGIAGLDIAEAAFSYKHADNKYGKISAGVSFAEAGLRIGLAATATSGVTVPVLVGGMLVGEAVKLVVNYKEKRYVAPVISELKVEGS